MSAAFVDTSSVVAITLKEPGSAALAQRLAGYDTVFASNLLEAELRATCRRERVPVDLAELNRLAWMIPSRSLSPEISRVLEVGYLRGPDCWHLATALYMAPKTDLPFITLDAGQAKVARALGFPA